MTSVVVVDDQELVRSGFALILERPGLDVVGEAADGLDAVEISCDLRPDVVLMDLRMPRLDGIEATRRIVAACPATKVLALTTFDLDEYVYAAIRAGASGFLLKDVSPTDLAHAVAAVSRGDVVVAPALTRRLLERFISAPNPERRPRRFRGCQGESSRCCDWSPEACRTGRSANACSSARQPSRPTSRDCSPSSESGIGYSLQ